MTPTEQDARRAIGLIFQDWQITNLQNPIGTIWTCKVKNNITADVVAKFSSRSGWYIQTVKQ